MSRVKGQITTCDRCGEQVFRKYIGRGEMDGGFTTWDKFEDEPAGWGYEDRKDLCPKCNAERKALIDEYYARVNTFYEEV